MTITGNSFISSLVWNKEYCIKYVTGNDKDASNDQITYSCDEHLSFADLARLLFAMLIVCPSLISHRDATVFNDYTED